MADARSFRKGLLLALVSAVAYGAMPILGKLAYAAGVRPWTLLAWRFGLALAVLGWLDRRMPGLPWPVRRRLWVVGACFSCNALAYFAALERVPASTLALLVYTYPVLVTLLSAGLGLEPLTLRGLTAAGLAFAGSGLTLGALPASAPAYGTVLSLLCAVFYSIYIVLSGRVAASVPSEAVARHVAQASFALYLPLALARGEWRLPPSAAAWLATLGLGLLSTVVALRAFLGAVRHLGPSRAAVASSLEMVMTLILAVAVLGERIGLYQFLGALLIVGAVAFQSLGRRRL